VTRRGPKTRLDYKKEGGEMAFTIGEAKTKDGCKVENKTQSS
jgi:hypothetical protein